jgi:hypothetical protein
MRAPLMLWAVLMLSTAFALEPAASTKLSALKNLAHGPPRVGDFQLVGKVLLEGTVLLESSVGIFNTLPAGYYIAQNTAFSNNGYTAILQTDGNFVVYNSAQKALWSSGTYERGTAPYILVMQTDNNLVLYDSTNRALWASNTWEKGQTGAATMTLQSNGNVVVTDSNGATIWSSNSGQGSTPSTPSTPSSSSYAQNCVAGVNAFRATLGLPALAENTGEESCANNQAGNDLVSNVAHAHFGACNEFGQCECPNWSDPSQIQACLQMMWNEGPGGGHYDIMSSTSYTKMACGYSTSGSNTWMVQNYYF